MPGSWGTLGKDTRSRGVLSRTPQFCGVRNSTEAFGGGPGGLGQDDGARGAPEQDIVVPGRSGEGGSGGSRMGL